MMKIIVIVISMLVASSVAKSQNVLGGTSDLIYLKPLGAGDAFKSLKRGSYVGPHVLGDSITMKKDFFEKEYIYFKKGIGAYAVEEKIIEKKTIYNAINRVDKYFVSSLQENPNFASDYKNRLSSVYDIGIKLKRYNTVEIEKNLRKMKDPLQIEEFLKRLKFN